MCVLFIKYIYIFILFIFINCFCLSLYCKDKYVDIHNSSPADIVDLIDFVHVAISPSHKDSLLSFGNSMYINITHTNIKFKLNSNYKDFVKDSMFIDNQYKYNNTTEYNMSAINVSLGSKITKNKDFHITVASGIDVLQSDDGKEITKFSGLDGVNHMLSKKSTYIGYSNHISYYGYNNKIYTLLTSYTSIFKAHPYNATFNEEDAGFIHEHSGRDSDCVAFSILYNSLDLRFGKVFDINDYSFDTSMELGYSDFRGVSAFAPSKAMTIKINSRFFSITPGVRIYGTDNYHLLSLGINELSWNFKVAAEASYRAADSGIKAKLDKSNNYYIEQPMFKTTYVNKLRYNFDASIRLLYNGTEIFNIGYQILRSGNSNVTGNGYYIGAHLLLT